MTNLIFLQIFPVFVSFLCLIFALVFVKKISQSPPGSEKMIEISQAIKEGAIAFLKRQYKNIAIIAIFLFILLFFIFDLKSAIGFLIGAIASGFSGFLGMIISSQTNTKVAEGAKKGIDFTLSLALKGGAVTGFLVAGLGLLAISGFYFLTHDLKALIALGFGGSLISVFARLGGGIYTKAADVGADLVGKIEKGIPEDDPRNPAVIADQVGDLVGDCAGMAADIFETFVVTIVAAMLLGELLFKNNPIAIFLPLNLAAIGVLASILSFFLIKLGKDKNIILALSKGLVFAILFSLIGFWLIIFKQSFYLERSFLSLFLPTLVGVLLCGAIFLITDYFTSKKYQPVKSIALSSQAGAGPNIISGLAVGMESTLLPIIAISIATLISFKLGGLYGIAISAVSMLSLSGLIVTLDSYGPITDNAAGIAEMTGLSPEIRKTTDALDAVGNTTKATTKGYAIASAGLSALILFSAYTQELTLSKTKFQFFLEDPKIIAGLFLGGIITYYFAALALSAVGKTASKVVDEVRRQFKEIEGLMEGKRKPEYSQCVDIVTKSALREMILPALLPIIFPILTGFILGLEALGGLLIGSIVVGIFLAIQMTSGGAAWDNAKKYIEEGNLGGKGSLAHQAAVVGDTVGDPCKDTAGPAINPMIKVLNIVALLVVRILIR